jgi:hypothetical protein
MSYVNTYLSTRRRPAAVGGLLDTAQKYLDQAGGVIKAGTTILQDPALPKIVANVMELNSLEKKSPSTSSSGSSSGGQGIGLNKVVRPLEAFVFYRKNEWILPVALAGVVGAPFLLGYLFGKRKRGAK